MNSAFNLDPLAVKSRSEETIRHAGGQICDWLPEMESLKLRVRDEIVGRALVLNALLQIHFQAPVKIINAWINNNNVDIHLTQSERLLLQKDEDSISDQQRIDLYWYIEALWALMWVGDLIEDLPFDKPVQDFMVTLVPDLQKQQDGAAFEDKMRIRPYHEVFQMLDLYFRIHWYVQDGKLNGYSTAPFSFDVILERRKALEWVLHPGIGWDDVSIDT